MEDLLRSIATPPCLAAKNIEDQKKTSRRIKEVAAEHGRDDVGTHTLVNLVQGNSDADAQNILKHYQAGADHDAIDNIYRLRVREKVDTRAAQLRDRFK